MNRSSLSLAVSKWPNGNESSANAWIGGGRSFSAAGLLEFDHLSCVIV